MAERGRPKKDPNQPTTYTFKIDTSENIKKSLARLVNLTSSGKMPLNQVRMINELIKTMITLQKNIDLEERMQEIEDMLNMNRDDE